MSKQRKLAIRQPSPFVIQRITKPDFMQRLLGLRYELFHGPTNYKVGHFRRRDSATKVIKWLTENLPADVIEGTDPDAISKRGEAAGIYDFMKGVRDADR